MSSFIHLHTHSHYSLLDGLSKVGPMVDLAKKYEMPALALTDHGVLYGAIEFYKKCKTEGIKPIIGLEAYIAQGSMYEKRAGIDNRRYHLTLLAQNEKGYSNLVKLVSLSHLEGFYYKPRIDKELLRQHSEGLVCLSGCMASELSRALENKNMECAEEVIAEYKDIFGKDRYFLEIMHHPNIEGLLEVRAATIDLARKHNLPLVGTQDSHYLHDEDARAHETLLAIQQNTDLDDARRLSLSGDSFSFIDTKTAKEYFADIPEAVENTEKIAEMCTLSLSMGDWNFPNYEIPKGTSYDSELKRLTYEGLKKKNMKETKEVRERIEYELNVIKSKGYSPYFLVVGDLLHFAQKRSILTTTRGSAAGSLVSYLTGITNVDPLYFKLPFERFLNPERPSAPDVDMDFADDRRDEVIAYARHKYGEDKVAQIGTFGTMMARGAVRDVARSLGYPYATGDRISKLIPFGLQGFPMTIDRALATIPELEKIYKQEDDAREIIDLAKKLEGTVRHISVHAAGVVISSRPLSEFVPLQYDPQGERIITQYDMHSVEDMGLLKFDFLGIKNLTILSNTRVRVRENYGKDIDVEKIPMDDKETFELLTRGETLALFQLNGQGMTRYLKELKPTSIHDINLMVALYRPGPMENINEYIARKNAQKETTYAHPKMEEFLSTTHGVLVYQDDLLMSAIKVAGYSWGEVDKFRKAVGKKNPEEMAKQHILFVEKCQKYSGMSEKDAEHLWSLFEPFQGYGFNKAHAASYGKVAYQTAYMKTHYPTEYMASVLTADAGDTQKISELIVECIRIGIPVLPPDVNESFGDFTVIKASKPGLPSKSPDSASKKEVSLGDQIRFGLYSIKNFGREIADALIEERGKNGKFTSFEEFLGRIHHRNLNKKSLESLIKCGALDKLEGRAEMLANMEEALSYSKSQTKMGDSQSSLFSLMNEKESLPSLRLKGAKKLTLEEKLIWERELLGVYVSGHPLDPHKEKIAQKKLSIGRLRNYREGITTPVAGIFEEIRTITTSKGEPMAFAKIADINDRIDAVIFPRTYALHRDLLEEPVALLINGKISHRNGELSLVVEKIKKL
ncbi:MAG: DNA polymerase III subunit alpha [Candidatus Paceibacterota bacterium]